MPRKKKKIIINPKGILKGVARRSDRMREILDATFDETEEERKRRLARERAARERKRNK